MSHVETHEDLMVEQALRIVRYRLSCNKGEKLDSSQRAIQYAKLKLSMEKREIFSGIMLDAQVRVIDYREFFVGTLSSCAVYPREVVRDCITENACSIIFLHNHPSGALEPSVSDVELTRVLKQALKLIEVSVVDHIVVAGGHSFSMAENGTAPF